ncbi:unnamed protein product [Pedinophyceae sp. YPF-701]|nr:unnamed protein product [Pedinophyceae sp. YPF-701]
MKLANKKIVVTGANQGIGLEFVRQLVAKGNTVIATARNPAAAKDLRALADANAGQVHITTLDQSDPANIAAWAKEVAGVAPAVDLVLNNAGIYGPKSKAFGDYTKEDMLEVFNVNAVGPFLIAQEMVKSGLLPKGSVIGNMSSKVGSVADNGSGGGYAYRASKSAQNIISKSMSLDLAGAGITTVMLHPGYVRTNMTGGNGLIDVDECVSGLISVLESDRELNGRWYDFAGKEIPW